MLAGGRIYQCSSISGIQVVDTTGGGNSSSGAVLYACCEGYEPQMAGCMGSAAAAEIIAQFGTAGVGGGGRAGRAFARAKASCKEEV